MATEKQSDEATQAYNEWINAKKSNAPSEEVERKRLAYENVSAPFKVF